MLLTEITLQANNLTSLRQFYKEVVDLPVLFFDEKSLRVGAGKSRLIFKENNALSHPFYHLAFNIPSNKFEEAFDWFRPRVRFIWIKEFKSYIADFKNWDAKSFYFYDPCGNILEVIARRDLQLYSDQPFSGELIDSISELGIVFSAQHYAEEVDKFMNKYSLNYFSKQPPGKHFNACGDENGLFILVPEGRDWYPGTKKNSVNFPVGVSFQTESGHFSWKNND